MPTSTYPKEWKRWFIFVSAAMIPESPPLKDAKAAIDDSVPILSADEIVHWKRMYENPTTAFIFSEGILAMGGLSPFYSVRPKAFFGKKEMTLRGLFQGDSRDIKFVVDDKVEPGLSRGVEMRVTEGSVQAGDSSAGEKDEGASSGEREDSPGSLQVGKKPSLPQKLLPNFPLLGLKGSSYDPIEIPTAPSSSRVRDKTPEVSAARIIPAFEISPHHATGTSKPSHFEGFASRSPLAPLFADALPVPYIPKWKITQSSVVGTPETAWDFLAHAVPPSHRFMNSALRDDLFDDQCSMSFCKGLFRGVGMLQQVDDLRKENEGLKSDLKTSQTVATELRCQVVEAECKLQEEKLGKREMAALVEEKEELAMELKHQKELNSVSQEQLDTMYAEWGITSDDNQKLAKEKYWLITEGFRSFLTVVSQSEEFKSSLKQIYRAYQDVGYQAGLKDGYAYPAQGLGRKETPLYNSKAKKQLSKLD
ncbi:hypothetical protein HanPI659440_Chr14g0563341 [Helianthus annuus]|nr:hypothetical protein HanPI659440_Chr14g0563341 [Helianthus annuus]